MNKNKLNFQKKYIPFSDIPFNLNNPPRDKLMLILDPVTKMFSIFINGQFIKIKTCAFDDIIKDGKIDLSVMPQQLASKCWVLSEIDKKTKNVFILKGKKCTLKEILDIKNPKVGEVWLCKEKSAQYVYTEQKRWEQLGSLIKFEFKQLDKIFESITKLEKQILENKLLIQSEIVRAKQQQNILNSKIESTNQLISKQTVRASTVQQLLSAALKVSNSAIAKQENKIESLNELLSGYHFQQIDAKITSMNSTIKSQSQALSEIYTNMDILQDKVDRKVDELQEYFSNSTSQISKLLYAALEKNNLVNQQKMNILSASLYAEVNDIITQTQIRINDAISAAGIVELSGIPEKIETTNHNIELLSTQINNQKIQRNYAILSGISQYDDKLSNLKSQIAVVVHKINNL